MAEPTSRILIFRIGSLGDTIVSLPAIAAAKAHFAGAELWLLNDHEPRVRTSLARMVIDASGLVDRYVDFPVLGRSGSKARAAFRLVRLWIFLRRQRFDAVVYLAPSVRVFASRQRDARIFRSMGIRLMLGFRGFRDDDPMVPRHEVDALLHRLAMDGIAVPRVGKASFPYFVNAARRAKERFPPGGKPRIGVNVGGKKPVTLWPLDRYEQVVKALVAEFDPELVFFGGPSEKAPVARLIAAAGRGIDATCGLSFAEQLKLLASCRFLLSNDTGAVHMAASVGTPCVSPYSAIVPEGQWYPYGEQHLILRRKIACENCYLADCVEKNHACLLDIGVSEVVDACREMFQRTALVSGS